MAKSTVEELLKRESAVTQTVRKLVADLEKCERKAKSGEVYSPEEVDNKIKETEESLKEQLKKQLQNFQDLKNAVAEVENKVVRLTIQGKRGDVVLKNDIYMTTDEVKNIDKFDDEGFFNRTLICQTGEHLPKMKEKFKHYKKTSKESVALREKIGKLLFDE